MLTGGLSDDDFGYLEDEDEEDDVGEVCARCGYVMEECECEEDEDEDEEFDEDEDEDEDRM